jgi:hypothetical protein
MMISSRIDDHIRQTSATAPANCIHIRAIALDVNEMLDTHCVAHKVQSPLIDIGDDDIGTGQLGKLDG